MANRLYEGRSLELSHPEIAADWHPTHNGFSPSEIAPASNKKVWWMCEKGHEWQSTPNSRALKGSRCPYCSGRKIIVGETDLATRYPHIAQEWHTERNGVLDLESVPPLSHSKVWWICAQGHEWEASVCNRTNRGSGCPYCSGRRAIAGVNDLATLAPRVADQWHPTRNGNLKPSTIAARSGKKVWWQCSLDPAHEWDASPDQRLSGHGCTICSGRRVIVGCNDLATNNVPLAKQWHPTKNGDLRPTHVTASSNRKVWWMCDNNHEWQADINNRHAGKGCKECNDPHSSKIERLLMNRIETMWLPGVTPDRIAVSHPSFKRGIQVDGLGELRGRSIVIEYDGCYWHRTPKAFARDTLKTSLLLSMGYVVVRVRESVVGYNKLAFLNLSHPHLIQIHHEYSSYKDIDPTETAKQIGQQIQALLG